MRPLKENSLVLASLATIALATSACSTQDPERHELSSLSDLGLENAEQADLMKVSFSDRKEANLLFKSFSGAIVETNYEQGFHVMERDASTEEKLKNAGFKVESYQPSALLRAAVPSLSTDDARQTLGLTPLAVGATNIPNYPCYETVEETYAAAADLAEQHPHLARWHDVGDSWRKTVGLGGYDMMVLALTNQLIIADKPKLFLTCAMHAREYATAALCLDFAQELLASYQTDADTNWILDHHEVHLMLQANPDGRKAAEAGLMWRKNVNENYCSPSSAQRGADLNRNFSFGWNCCSGSSTSPCSETFHGASPASEPEAKAMQNYMLALFPDSRPNDYTTPAPATTSGIFLDIHSYSELVLWPWGSTSNQAPNHSQLQTLGRRLAHFNGYSPEQAISLYPTDGTSDDFSYGELGVASYTLEIGTAFFENCSSYNAKVRPDNLKALRYAAKVARTPYITPAGPSTISLGITLQGTTASLNAQVSDTPFNNQNGIEVTQAIVAAEYYVDVAPWQPGANAVALNAIDGTFNTNNEAVQGTIDPNTLTPGRHLIFVRGKDASNVWGPVSGIFLDVENTSCSSDAECDDGNYCNGSEVCGQSGSCEAGSAICNAQLCDELEDRCVDCLGDQDCSDGQFCNGSETCDSEGQCRSGATVCAESECDEQSDRCVNCFTAADCDDGIACTTDTCNSGECDSNPNHNLCQNGAFCDGVEVCAAGIGCVAGSAVCTGSPNTRCNEASDRCVACLSDADCQDSVACTVNTCNLSTGSCLVTPSSALCNNGLFCDGSETCHATLGCQPGSAPCANCNEQTDLCEATGCTVQNAVDLGARGVHKTIAGNACAKLTQLPDWWKWTSRQAQLQSNGTGSFPLGFTWTQACTATGGSGILQGPWATTAVGTVSENCPVLFKFNGGGNLGVTWY